ncbi:MAG: Gfo/Idh/MocA family oxidoreductase [Sedimentisphaerales bacterium]|nr:Gfo/Idh/MocA family oxidoreductase [Sedimentisphaerales bacterium]
MSEGIIETVVLGLNADGQALLEAAYLSDRFNVLAVADKDIALAERLAGEYGCTGYDDYRQLITATDAHLEDGQERCLIVAAGMYSCEEYVRLAMKKRFNVLKASPAGRDFEEAAELVRLAAEDGVHLAVVNPMRYAGSFSALHDYIKDGRIEEVFLISAFCSYAGVSRPGWQSDPKLAGGGVLVHYCFGMIDQILWSFPVPQQVYSLNTNQATDKQQRLSLTEDTAVVTMKFSDRLLGNLIVSSRSSVWPREQSLTVCGKDRILVVNDRGMTVRDGQGRIEEEFSYEYDRVGCMRGVVDDFASGILASEEKDIGSSGRENLKNMAVIESAYLSGRTGMPEEPGRIMQRKKFEPDDVDGDV